MINATTYSSSLQVSGFSILYPFFSSRNNSLLSMVGYGVPPDTMIYESERLVASNAREVFSQILGSLSKGRVFERRTQRGEDWTFIKSL